MAEYFDICGTHIPVDSIKDFRTIEVEFVFRPVYHEVKKSMMNAFSGKKFEFVSMQPYAAIIGQQGHKSALGEYKAKDFINVLADDILCNLIHSVNLQFIGQPTTEQMESLFIAAHGFFS